MAVTVLHIQTMEEESVYCVEAILDVLSFENGCASHLLVITSTSRLFCFDIETSETHFSFIIEETIKTIILQPEIG